MHYRAARPPSLHGFDSRPPRPSGVAAQIGTSAFSRLTAAASEESFLPQCLPISIWDWAGLLPSQITSISPPGPRPEGSSPWV